MQNRLSSAPFLLRQFNCRLSLFFLILSLFAPAVALAVPTSSDQALRVVQYWLFQNPKPLKSHMGTEVRDLVTFDDEQGIPLYHVVNLKPEGFVIISGDDDVEPIIAFVPRGEFDSSDVSPLSAMVNQDISLRVETARKREISTKRLGVTSGALSSSQEKWLRLDKAVHVGAMAPKLAIMDAADVWVTPFLESKWGQGTENNGELCYNRFTPSNRFAGCVATAMSQVMYHFKYPTEGVGTPSFQISVDGGAFQDENLLGGEGDGEPYKWHLMEDGPGIEDATHREAIGYLLHDAGVSVNMAYGIRVSIANTLRGGTRLVDTFDYSNAKLGIKAIHQELPEENRNKMMNPNLDAGFPVILSVKYHNVANGTWVGHAVVSDGYGYDNQTLYHHLSMGWSGRDDAWYNLPDIDADTHPLNLVQSVVYNIYTPDNNPDNSETGEIISGRVTDSNGLPIPGVEITAVRDGGGTYLDTTNDKGIYALVKVDSNSVYMITALQNGYSFDAYDNIDHAKVSTLISEDDKINTGNVWGVDFSGVSLDPIRATLTTQAVTNIGNTTATGNGTITEQGNAEWINHGMCWGETPNPDYTDQCSSEGSVRPVGAFTSSMTQLSPGTRYYVRAYIFHRLGRSYGNEVEFSTAQETLPTVTTSAVTNIGLTSATGMGSISTTGSTGVVQHGVCWGLSENPVTTGTCTRQGVAGTGDFSGPITGLIAGTMYHVRAYAVNGMGTAYGNDVLFTTNGYSLPTLASFAATDVSATNATVSGSIFVAGNPLPMSQHGFCWDNSAGIDISDTCSDLGPRSKIGSFSESLSGLTPRSTYYVRPYAINAAGIAYGPERSFTTDNSDGGEMVVTGAVRSITGKSAVGSGYLTIPTNLTLTQHGVCWSKSSPPTVDDFCSKRGEATKIVNFTSSITGLSSGITYYVRAYGSRNAATAYGDEVSFTTAIEAMVTTGSVVPANDRAIGIGSIVSLGGPNPSRHGFCWSTTPNPTTADRYLDLGPISSTGPFAAILTGLSPATTYHVRAYVTNNFGTSYGLNTSFTTGGIAGSSWSLFLPAILSAARP